MINWLHSQPFSFSHTILANRTSNFVAMTDISEASAPEFARSYVKLHSCERSPLTFLQYSFLSFYRGPYVKIQVNSGNHEYTVSKTLLCRESAYFSAMFENEFKEGQEQKATLDKVEGVVSAQSFEALLQWLYLGRVKFELMVPEDQISAAIELARFADMCQITGLESEMARYIEEILNANPEPEPFTGRHVDINTYCLEPRHIISATLLPGGHSVRQILAKASVGGYLRDENHKFKQETGQHPTFGSEVLQEVRKTLNGLEVSQYEATVNDPLSGRRIKLNSPFV